MIFLKKKAKKWRLRLKMKVLKFFLGLALIGLIWCDASDASDASNDIETIKTLVMQIFQWYKNEMQTVR